MSDLPPKKEAVILLHGIGLNKWSMIPVNRILKKDGYIPIGITYPSTKLSIDDIADWLSENHLTPNFWNTYSKVHFVTHSMGGLVARRYLNKFRTTLDPYKIGRVVMLGTPNSGSEMADLMVKHFPPYRFFYGPAGQELATEIQSKNMDAAYFETGIIAGSGSWLYPVSSRIIKDESDGRVAVEKTKLTDMKDHITLYTSHTFMIYRKKVHSQILHFLKYGSFDTSKLLK
jgi:pimeloyl-ACP methyl ester carboxylesterase